MLLLYTVQLRSFGQQNFDFSIISLDIGNILFPWFGQNVIIGNHLFQLFRIYVTNQ